MSAGSIAVRARQRARDMMTSTCVIYERGARTTDPVSGEVTDVGPVLWSGPCRVRPAATGLTALSEAIGGAETFRFDYRVSIPFEVSMPLEGLRLVVDTSPDPALVGTVMEIQRVDRGDDITARRLICQRVA